MQTFKEEHGFRCDLFFHSTSLPLSYCLICISHSSFSVYDFLFQCQVFAMATSIISYIILWDAKVAVCHLGLISAELTKRNWCSQRENERKSAVTYDEQSTLLETMWRKSMIFRPIKAHCQWHKNSGRQQWFLFMTECCVKWCKCMACNEMLQECCQISNHWLMNRSIS